MVTLSASRAADFLGCPLRYRLRVVDRIPEAPGLDAVRGTLVHAVLERMFDLPRPRRNQENVVALIDSTWERHVQEHPRDREVVPTEEDVTGLLGSASDLVRAYFLLEDPARLDPAEREAWVEVDLSPGLRLVGRIDRIDIASGLVRVVDYKTGKSPSERFQGSAIFQMLIYSLAISKTRGVVPSVCQLIYLKNRDIIRYHPDARDLRYVEQKVDAIAQAIRRARETHVFRPKPSKLCDYCSYRPLCPAWGGTPPPYPEEVPS